MKTQLEKSLVKNVSFTSVHQKLINDLHNFADGLIANLNYQGFSSQAFITNFNNLSYEQKKLLIKNYSDSFFPLLSTTLNANMGATHVIASELFQFLLQEGFKFNKADLKYLKKNDNFAFKQSKSFGNIYEINWYYPLNKWIGQIKNLVFKVLNKSNSPIYLIPFPSSNIKFALMNHYEKLPEPIQSLVLRDANEKDMEIILNKSGQGSIEDLNFFKKSVL